MLKHVLAIILKIKNCTSIKKVVQAINYERILENHAFIFFLSFKGCTVYCIYLVELRLHQCLLRKI